MNFAFNVDPDDQKLTMKSNELVHKLRDRSLDEDEIAKLKTELKEVLNEQFELRQSKRQKDLEKLKKEVASLEKSIEDRNKKKSEIVERRISQLIGEPDELDWETNNGNNFSGQYRGAGIGNTFSNQPMNSYVTPNGTVIHTTQPLPGNAPLNVTPPSNQLLPNATTLPNPGLQPATKNQDSAKRIEELEREIRRLKSSNKQVPTAKTY